MQYPASNYQRHNSWSFKIAVADKKSRRVSEVLRWGASITIGKRLHFFPRLPWLTSSDVLVSVIKMKSIAWNVWLRYRISDFRRKMELDVSTIFLHFMHNHVWNYILHALAILEKGSTVCLLNNVKVCSGKYMYLVAP